MPEVLSGPEQLRNLFAALTEQTFQVEFGVADPALTDYLADLLVRFVRMDSVFRLRDIVGRRLEEVADMLMEAEQCAASPRAQMHRHIGDFTLFWTGVYPEALQRLKSWDRKDALINYSEQGKRSYSIAARLSAEESSHASLVFKRLSDEFELFSEGLHRVRHEWERLPASA